ncbi:transcriptional regulator [Streptomyces sp. A7024]|uniref:Transcriptional regulator n=1 Tax=Streptomyces coryli TaxID=1128680 RepID=A0A6G4UE57_9ACTN|nr:helix-turn-helix domain-containing protein [Streptomyces coryli]NGN70342.1 transcriptional regulator [Streptomyces coryli]
MSADAEFEAVSVLSEGSRRRMYTFIRRAGRPVTRDEAAAHVGISRKLAAFHLDKLVAAGLLDVGPAAPGSVKRVGRRPKAYEPTGLRLHVSIPERRHELLAGLLLDAVNEDRPGGEDAAAAALRLARRRGHRLGEAQRETQRPGRLGPERALTICERMLYEHGFEPVREGPDRLRQRNCPFHPFAERAPELVCGLNKAFLTGYLDGMRIITLTAELDPRPGECCVEVCFTEGRQL